MARPLTALTIGPSDPTGTDGIAADLKTFSALGLHGCAAITEFEAYVMPNDEVSAQIGAVLASIQVDALKLNVPHDVGLVEAIAARFRSRPVGYFILDPAGLQAGESALAAARDLLFPLADVIVPNIPEVFALTGRTVETWEEMREAAALIAAMGVKNVVIKAGKLEGDLATDLLFDGKDYRDYSAARVAGPPIRGTGATFGAALTATLAKGETIEHSVAAAKAYVTRALQDAYDLGDGPALHHFYRYWRTGAH